MAKLFKLEKSQINMKEEGTPQRIQYKYAGKQTLYETLRKAIPKQFYPTKIMAETLGIVFLIVIIFAVLQFPYAKLLSANPETMVRVGIPLTFLEFNLMKISENPVNTTNLILDIFIYIILSYAINVSINLILDTPLIKSKEEKKKYPKVFKPVQRTAADKLTQKIFKDKTQIPEPPSPNKV